MKLYLILVLVFLLGNQALQASAGCVNPGVLALRVSAGSGINVYDAWTMGTDERLQTGMGETYADPAKAFEGGWINKALLNQWKVLFANGLFTKVRFTMWKAGKPVVDILFNGKGSNSDSWFNRKNIIEVLQGPSVDVHRKYNHWSIKAEHKIGRHFYVSLKYGGCPNDFAYFFISDKAKTDPCQGYWNEKKKWANFPVFFYSLDKEGTLMTKALGMADTVTITVL